MQDQTFETNNTPKNNMMSRAIAALLLPVVAVVADFPSCSLDEPTCPEGLTCDLVAQRCFHEPRQLGEACGNVPSSRKCDKYDLNTTHELECSTWCGVCVLKDELAEREQRTISFAEQRTRHIESMHVRATRCGITSNLTFVNFEEDIITNMPIVYPKNDSELAAYYKTIADNNCKARPVGATHTSSSVITSEAEYDTIGISLAEYHPDDKAWDMVLDQGNSSIKIPAGRSLFDLFQAIRPYGFFLPTQTAGPIFTIGGIITNTVHGGVFKAGFVSQYVRSLRVAVWNGHSMEIRIVDSEAELRNWRNSFGMLGVITSAHLSLEKRVGFEVSSARKKLHPFTRETVDDYFNDLEKNYIYAESFFNPYDPEVNTILFATGKTVPAKCDNFTDSECKWDYPKAHCENEDCCQYRYKFGDITLGESCRAKYAPVKSTKELQASYKSLESAMADIPYHGAPDLPPAQDSLICILEWAGREELSPVVEDVLALAFFDTTFLSLDQSVQTNGADVNDGFYLRGVPHAIKLMAYFVPRVNLYDMLLIIKEAYDEVTKLSGQKQLGNAEFRFLNVTDVATLFPNKALSSLPASGEYVNCEMVFNINPNGKNKWWSTTLGKYEEKMRALDGFPHLGKSFCYGETEGGEILPYQNSTCVKTIFNDDQKATFNAYRKTQDPSDLFAGGAFLEFAL